MRPEQYNELFTTTGEYIDNILPEFRTHQDNVVNDVFNLFFNFASANQNETFWDCLTNDSIESLNEIGASQFAPLFQGLYVNTNQRTQNISGLFKKSKIAKIRKKYLSIFCFDLQKMGGWQLIMEKYLANYILNNYKDVIDLSIE